MGLAAGERAARARRLRSLRTRLGDDTHAEPDTGLLGVMEPRVDRLLGSARQCISAGANHLLPQRARLERRRTLVPWMVRHTPAIIMATCEPTTSAPRAALPGLTTLLLSLSPSAPAATFVLPEGDDNLVGEIIEVHARQEDTLSDLARAYGLGYEEIILANPGVDPWLPGEGRTIRLPMQFVLPGRPAQGHRAQRPRDEALLLPQGPQGGATHRGHLPREHRPRGLGDPTRHHHHHYQAEGPRLATAGVHS